MHKVVRLGQRVPPRHVVVDEEAAEVAAQGRLQMWVRGFVISGRGDDFTQPRVLILIIPVQLRHRRVIHEASAEVDVRDGDQIEGRVEVRDQLEGRLVTESPF